jgi:4-phytase/acid phosphatase/peptide/nickel transport system substrate-binding protein
VGHAEPASGAAAELRRPALATSRGRKAMAVAKGLRVLLGALALLMPGAGLGAEQRGGSITVGLELDIPGFDPLKVGVYDTAANMAASLIFDTLTYLDDNGDTKPKLALSWSHSDDFKTWTFKLREGVLFHDGTPFDARVVKFNFDRQKDPKNNCRCAFYVANIKAVEVGDERTVVFELSNPAVTFPQILSPPTSNNVMHSPAAIAAKGDDYNRQPVGTGPFLVQSWSAGDRLVLVRNPRYWNPDRPFLDRVVMRPLPDAQARFASLEAGESDLVWDDEFDADNILKAQRNPALTVHTYAGSGAQVYAFNTKRAPFDDVRVRRALVMALDRKRMSQAITNGLSRPARNPFGDGSWVKCKDDGALPYDLAQAQELLKAYGKPVHFKMLVTATPRGRRAGQVLQQFWKEAGADMEIEQVDQTAIVTRAFARQFDMTPWRIIDFVEPDVQMYANFHTGSPVALANYSNPELDALLEHARTSADQEQRSADYCAASRLINSEAIWFFTFQNTYYAIAKAKLKGLPKLYNGVIDVSPTWLE